MNKLIILKKYILYRMCILLVFANQLTNAQNDTINYDALSLEDLMNIKISVASIKELTTRESPGIVSYISAKEIKETGARDLMDVLRLVPGFDFACDVEGVVGLGVRGNWAHEGKVLLLIDGQEMNEGLYSTIQLGNHYPIENIKHIEIIRGPGSAIYGGNAEYAVINIITNDATDINGIKVSGLYGQTANTFGHRGFTIEAGENINNLSVAISASGIQSKRSDGVYTDAFGSSYDMSNSSKLNNGFLNLKIGYKNLKIKAIADWYHTETRDEYQQILSKPINLNFDSYFLEIKDEFVLSAKLKIIPRVNYKKHLPWQYIQTDPERADGTPFNITNERYQASLLTSYDPVEKLNINFGAELYTDRSTNNIDNEVFTSTNTSKMYYKNIALFVQALTTNRFVNLTAGLRYNINSLYDAGFVPRFGATKVIGKFHIKALYSKAFRAPSTMNIDPSPGIKPEKTTVTELETGVQINRDLFFSVNAYDIKTSDIIIYYYDETVAFDGYTNFPKSGTRGLEFILRYKKPIGHIDFSCSYYTSKNVSTIDNYSVPQNNNVLLGFPSLKYSINAGLDLTDHLTWNITSTLLSKRYAITSVNESTNEHEYTQLPVFCQLNTFFNYSNLPVCGLNIGIGVYNILNQHEWFIQPYNSLHAPLPGLSREYTVKLSYSFVHN